MIKNFIYLIIILPIFSFNLSAQTNEHRFEIGGLVTGINLNKAVGEHPVGIGGRFGYNFTKNVAFDGEIDYFPQNPSGNFGETLALAGVKVGVHKEKFGVFAKVRPGVIKFGGDFFRAYNDKQLTNFAVDVGGVVEYYPNKRLILRFDVGDTIIPFGGKTINQPLPPYTFKPGTTHNIQTGFGIGFRF